MCVCVCEMIRAFVHWDGSDGGTAAAAGGGEYGGGGGGRLLLGRLGETSLPASARVLLMSACWWW